MDTDHLEILCVDDDQDIRTIVALALGLDGKLSVRLASNSDDAMRLLRGTLYCPDCILLDMKLPGGDGKQLLGEIRRVPRLVEVPIVFFTASVSQHDRDDIRSLGAAGLIEKPFDPLQLATSIRTILAAK